MGLGVHQNILRSAAGDQLLQNEAVADVPGAGVELAVGKGTGAALPELNVGGEVQLPGGPEALHVLRPALHAPSTLQQDGTQPRPGQYQGGKEARGARAHHHRRNILGRQRGREQIAGGALDPGDFFAAAALEHGGLIF